MKSISIMQPHFFPWFGYFELIKNSDLFIFLDDVEFPHRSYVNRVKFQFQNKIDWLSLPIKRDSNKLIKDVKLFNKKENFKLLKKKISYSLKKNNNYHLVDTILNKISIEEIFTINEFNKFTIKAIASIIFKKKIKFFDHSGLKEFKKSDRILEICRLYKAESYLTAHGSKHYLDFKKFEKLNINVEFLNYNIKKYKNNQIDNLSILDILSIHGVDAIKFFDSKKISWKSFVKIN